MDTTKVKELVARLDLEVTYPGEAMLTKYLPGVDRIVDWVLAGVLTVEHFWTSQGDPHHAEKKEDLLTMLYWALDCAPMPAIVRTFILPLLKASLPALIDRIVEGLNKLIGRADNPEKNYDLTELLPEKALQPDQFLTSWVKDAAAGVTS